MKEVGVAVGVGTRSSRRASAAPAHPALRGIRTSLCSTAEGGRSRAIARFAPGARTRERRRDAPSHGPRLRREAQGSSAAPGRAFFGLPLNSTPNRNHAAGEGQFDPVDPPPPRLATKRQNDGHPRLCRRSGSAHSAQFAALIAPYETTKLKPERWGLRARPICEPAHSRFPLETCNLKPETRAQRVQALPTLLSLGEW
jgi:hypothetical protein